MISLSNLTPSPEGEEENAFKLEQAKAWLKGQTIRRETSRYTLDLPQKRFDAPFTAGELAAVREYERELADAVYNFIAGVEA